MEPKEKRAHKGAQRNQSRSSTLSAATGTRDTAPATPALDSIFAVRAADLTPPTTANQRVTESPTSCSLVSGVWQAACAFVESFDGEEDVEEEEEGNSGIVRESFLPRYLRGFGWRDDAPRGSRTAWYTEVDNPLPRPPDKEYQPHVLKTIHENPHLFHVSTPINIDRFANLLTIHPNQRFVASVVRSLRVGLWPWADTNPTGDFPETWDNAWANIPSEKEHNFISDQCNEEVQKGHHSPPFGPDLLPGMYSTPNIAVPKPHTDGDLRLVANQSAGQFCQNIMVNKAETRGARLDSLLVFIPLLLFFAQMHPGKRLLLWKSDVTGAFRNIPIHPLWQIKQVVTANIRWLRYVDWRACFGNCGSPRAWASFMGLVVWIAICIFQMTFLCCYVDDCFSVGLVGDMAWYEPYQQYFPAGQTHLLSLWDWLGIPHKLKKQVWGEMLVIIGFLVDPNELTATLPTESKIDLINHVRDFVSSPRRSRTLHEFEQLAGWVNWSLNVYPLFKPALCNVYAKMSGKHRSHAQIRLNKPLTRELLWFVDHVQASSGMLFFANLDWNPYTEANLTIYCDASLTGMGFWIPELNLGFSCPVEGDSLRDRIFFWEALCVLAALEWYEKSNLAFFASPLSPARLTIFTDNSNTVNIFNTLRARPEYNDILLASVDIRVRSNIDIRVLHVSHDDNVVADALSRDYFDVLHVLTPDIKMESFKPPRLTLGAEQK
ncbi:hypothetical protein BDZ89DRAFT_974667 [Hymenopellis radicata]|nr:hypothetical protein BDZ89DRAFT_974667 [Hymenopellis radicata]